MRRWYALALLLLGSASAAYAKVDNFMLLDHLGQAQELHYYSDADAVVLMVQGNGCPVVRNALPDLADVRERHAGNNVVFLMINSNLQDDRESVRAEAAEWNIDLPIMIDETQLVGESLGLTRTAEALVIDPAGSGKSPGGSSRKTSAAPCGGTGCSAPPAAPRPASTR